MGLTDSEIRAILADNNELSDSSDEELASEEDLGPEDLVLVLVIIFLAVLSLMIISSLHTENKSSRQITYQPPIM